MFQNFPEYGSSELDHEGMTLVDQCWEYEKATNTVSVKGKLARSVKFWEQMLQAPDWNCECCQVRLCYALHVPSNEVLFCKSNQNSALVNVQFVDQAIDELLANGCSEGGGPWACSPLSVVESSAGKKRLVLNFCRSRGLSMRTQEQLRHCLKAVAICSLLTSNRVIIMWIYAQYIRLTLVFHG